MTGIEKSIGRDHPDTAKVPSDETSADLDSTAGLNSEAIERLTLESESEDKSDDDGSPSSAYFDVLWEAAVINAKRKIDEAKNK